jgi:hypothetical protein
MENSSDYEISESSDVEAEDSSNNEDIEIVTNKPNNLLTSQIGEINNKINFIMNQLSKEDNISSKTANSTDQNNIHDIILFVIFGIFVLLVLESLYKLATKVLKAKHGLNINLS